MKLTTTVLKKIIAEEVAKFQESKLFGDMTSTEDAAKEAEEVDADELADALENHIDHYKALGLEETRLIKRLAQIHEAKKVAAKKVAAKKKAKLEAVKPAKKSVKK
jgi:regulator of replication initiation timing